MAIERAVLALGSNIEPRLQHLRRALQLLEAGAEVRVLRRSRIFESHSVGSGGEGDFLNAALEIETALSARELLSLCQSIESTCGRQPPREGEHRPGARTLDVDILSFGEQSSCEAALLLPHPRALSRAFVLRPVLDLLEATGSQARATELSWDQQAEPRGTLMLREMCKSKIHRARVTEANVDYIGSLTVDSDLLEASGILPYEKIQVVNVSNGERLETYAIAGERGSGVICLNGAAAHKGRVGDIVIVVAYGLCDEAEARALQPRIVFVDEANRIVPRQALQPAEVAAAIVEG